MSVRVQTEDFNISDEINALRKSCEVNGVNGNIGAIVTFTGTVRDMAGSNKITSMSLEYYPGMTEQQLTDIQSEAHSRWPLIDSTIIHRVGDLNPGDNIVLVITLSSHRHAAFESADFLMDFLKSKAPFWKKEQPLSGEAKWVDARESDQKSLDRWKP